MINPAERYIDPKHLVGGYVNIPENTYISIPTDGDDNISFSDLSAIAIDFWIKPKKFNTIIASRKNQFMIKLRADGSIYFYIYNGPSIGWKSAISHKNVLRMRKWNHVAIIYDGNNNVGFFINDKFSMNGIHMGVMDSSSGVGDLYIGKSPNFPDTASFVGHVGEFRIADISSWVTAENKILHTKPSPATYSLSLFHKENWFLDESEIKLDNPFYGDDYDPNDPAVQNLINAIGVDPTVVYSHEVIWEKIYKIWQFFLTYEIQEGDPKFLDAWDFIWSMPNHEFPSVLWRAQEFEQFGGFVWGGTCTRKAQYFAVLMRISGIPLSATAGVLSNWKHSVSGVENHFYNIVNIHGKWIPIDPSKADPNSLLTFPEFPAPKTYLDESFDYAHPYILKVNDEMNFEKIPLVVEPPYTYYHTPMSKIDLISPPDNMITKDNRILVMGCFPKPLYPLPGTLPDVVTVSYGYDNIEGGYYNDVPVYDGVSFIYFITSIPIEFLEESIDINVTYGEDSTTVTIFDGNS